MEFMWCLLLLTATCNAGTLRCTNPNCGMQRQPRQMNPIVSSCEPHDFECQQREANLWKSGPTRKYSPIVPIVSTCSPFDFECQQRYQLQWRRGVGGRSCSTGGVDCMEDIGAEKQRERVRLPPTVAKKGAPPTRQNSRCMPGDLLCWIKQGRERRTLRDRYKDFLTKEAVNKAHPTRNNYNKYLPGDFLRYILPKPYPTSRTEPEQRKLSQKLTQDTKYGRKSRHFNEDDLRDTLHGFYSNGGEWDTKYDEDDLLRDNLHDFYNSRRGPDDQSLKKMVNNYYGLRLGSDSDDTEDRLRGLVHDFYQDNDDDYYEQSAERLRQLMRDFYGSRLGPDSVDTGERLRGLVHDFYQDDDDDYYEQSAERLRQLMRDFYGSRLGPDSDDGEDRLRGLIHNFYIDDDENFDENAEMLRKLVHLYYSDDADNDKLRELVQHFYGYAL